MRTHEGGPLQNLGKAAPETNPDSTLILDFGPPELSKLNFCLSHPICGILLWHPKQTKTPGRESKQGSFS